MGDAMAVSSVKATINGTEYTLTYNSTSGKYEATLTAPTQTSGMNNNGVGPGVGAAAAGKGYYPVKLVATDDAGNVTTVDDTDPTLGESLRLKVKENVAPTVDITYPANGAFISTNEPRLRFNASDSNSGLKSWQINVDGMIDAEATATYKDNFTSDQIASAEVEVPVTLDEGEHTLYLIIKDYDGNKNMVYTTFVVDTVPPVLNVTSPTNGLKTNVATVNVSGTTNDVTSSPVTLTVKLNGGSAQSVTVNADGSFSKSITLAEGSNTIVITATDAAGKITTVTRTVTLDTGAPVFGAVSITPNPTDTGVQYTISVEVTD